MLATHSGLFCPMKDSVNSQYESDVEDQSHNKQPLPVRSLAYRHNKAGE